MNYIEKKAHIARLVEKHDFVKDLKIFTDDTGSADLVFLVEINGVEFHYFHSIGWATNINNDTIHNEINHIAYLYDRMFVNIDPSAYDPNFYYDVYMGRYKYETEDNRFINYLELSERLKTIRDYSFTNQEWFDTVINAPIPLFTQEELNISYSNIDKPEFNPNLRSKEEQPLFAFTA